MMHGKGMSRELEDATRGDRLVPSERWQLAGTCITLRQVPRLVVLAATEPSALPVSSTAASTSCSMSFPSKRNSSCSSSM